MRLLLIPIWTDQEAKTGGFKNSAVFCFPCHPNAVFLLFPFLLPSYGWVGEQGEEIGDFQRENEEKWITFEI